MTVRVRGGRFMLDIRHHHEDGRVERIRVAVPEDKQSKRAAEAYERSVLADLRAGIDPRRHEPLRSAGPVPTLAKFSVDYIETDARTNNRARTVREKEGMLRRGLLPRLGRLRLDAIGPREIELYKADRLRCGLGPKAVNEEVGLLVRMLRVATEWELLAHVPRARKLKVPPPKFDHLDQEEQDRLVRAAMLERDPWGVMVLAALKTGMRVSELRALRWEHIDTTAKRVHVVTAADDRGVITPPKNSKGRVLPIGDVLVAELKSHRHLRPFVFSNADGSMLTPRQCEHGIHRPCRRAGLRLIGWHALRHTYASMLVSAGAPLAVVKDLLGHGSLQMVMRYAHMSPDNRRDAVALLDRGHSLGTLEAPETKTAP